jgi:hypothetical protein
MATWILEPEQIAEIIPALGAAGVDVDDFEIVGFPASSFVTLTATDTTTAEWIASRGEPTGRVGEVLVWDETRFVPRPGKPNRTMRVGQYLYVIPIAGGTAAVVERQ